MITQKKITIPIFEYKLHIIIFDKWKELDFILDKEDLEDEGSAITISNSGGSIIATNSKSTDSIVHEAGHIKNNIWRYIGYEPMRDNDEVDQYLVAYIYNRIIEVYCKHNGIK